MKLGIMIEGQEGLTWERWRELCRRVEMLGFDSLWRSDHFFSLMGQRTKPALETWVSLVMAAQETSRIEFGPLVCSMTFRHPSLLARMAAQVSQLSGGRLVLGVGAGWHTPEHEAFGIDFPPVSQRMDMLDEGIDVLKALFAPGPANFDGAHYQLRDAEMYPKPPEKVPILVGGMGEKRTLRIVAAHADEWNAVSLGGDLSGPGLERYRQKTAVLDGYCNDLGRDPRSIKRSLMAGFLVGSDAADIVRRAGAIAEWLPPLAEVEVSERAGRLQQGGYFVGTTEEVVTQLQGLADAGVERVMLQHHNHDDFEVLDLIASEIMPRVV
ncbi:MAG: TIGR03560 family F420-dependent LLM class oxidoreductase [Dehalococcoidia bacterium]